MPRACTCTCPKRRTRSSCATSSPTPAAVGFHLGTTAAQHFPSLLAIAVPGPFLFFGDVPDEIKQATQQMQLGASFAEHVAGFDRESGR